MQKFMCYCTVFALFIFEFRAISNYKSPGASMWRGDLREGFLRYEVGAYIWRRLYMERLFSEFYGDSKVCPWPPVLFFQISL